MEDVRDSSEEVKQSFFAKQKLISDAKTTFQLVAAVVKNATLYPESHPSLLSSAEKLRGKIEEMLLGRKEVSFYLVAGELFFETYSIPLDQSLPLLMEQFVIREIGGIMFTPGLTTREIVSFAYLLNKEPAYFASAGSLNAVLVLEQITYIKFHRVRIVDKKVGSATKEVKNLSQVFQDTVDTVKEMVHALHIGKTVNMRRMNATVQGMVDGILENRDAFMGLTSIKMYDEYTFAHSVNTAILAISFGTFLSLNKPQVAALGMAALLHDIGKVSLPLEVVNKPGKLTDEEWEVIKRHPVEGAMILSDIPGETKMAMVVAFEHHRNGTSHGYPHVEEGFDQHVFSQIIAVVDAYEAITAARVYYRVRTPPDQAVKILMKSRGDDFDPVLVKAFVNMIGFFPIGTVLKLDTGEIGLVIHQTNDLMRPRVLLLSAFDGSEKETGTGVSLLETSKGKHLRSIVGTIDPDAANININIYLNPKSTT